MIKLIYEYLLPDIASYVVIGILTSSVFLKYLGSYSQKEIIGCMIGITIEAIVFSIALFFMDRLSDLKDKCMKMSVRDSLTGLYNLTQLIKIGEEYLLREEYYR